MNFSEALRETYTYKLFRFLEKESHPLLDLIGNVVLTFGDCLKLLSMGKIHVKNTIDQMNFVGLDGMFIAVTLTTVTGMIISIQVAHEMVQQGAGAYVGMLVANAMIRELGPVMAGFAVTSMIGSGMAAEISTMKVTSQVDALKVLKVEPTYYLILPRVLAGFTMVPLLVILGNFGGIIGGMFISYVVADLNMLKFLDSVWQGLAVKDVLVSTLKGGVFGLLITLISSSVGYQARGGAKEVGVATTTAVVWSFFAIVVFDYIISLIFFV